MFMRRLLLRVVGNISWSVSSHPFSIFSHVLFFLLFGMMFASLHGWNWQESDFETLYYHKLYLQLGAWWTMVTYMGLCSKQLGFPLVRLIIPDCLSDGFAHLA